MDDYSIFFDETAVDTPSGMRTAVRATNAPDGGVPLHGSGLQGAVYSPGTGVYSITRLQEVIDQSPDPQILFNATELNYRGHGSETTIADFVGDDAGSISGPGNQTLMDDAGFQLSGYIYIPPGVHEIEVVSDDGFLLELGGVEFSRFEGGRAPDGTARVADFQGGLYSLDMLYFDSGGGQQLQLRIDGVTVDSSAYFRSVWEFNNPPEGTEIVPVDEYHPSFFLGEDTLDGDDVVNGTWRADTIEGLGGDDELSGGNGNDHINGGYGDDLLEGDDGNDTLDGGRGSDMLVGGAGDDLLISRSDAGITRIGQLATGNQTRPDPDGEVNFYRQFLRGYEDQPLVAHDILVGGEGNDTFLFSPQINAKLEIIERHVRSDGTINWAGVAGENDELHDHWIDSFGIDVIADYNRHEDTIAVVGHTANVRLNYRDLNDDGVMDTVLSVYSQQMMGNGGAHDQDLIGQILVFGDRVYLEDVIVNPNVAYGIVDTIDEVAEALRPDGEVMVNDGVRGYDSRDTNGGLGSITGSPEDYVDNPWWDELEVAGRSRPDPVTTRGSFDQLGTEEVEGQTINGSAGNDRLAPTAESQAGIPGALGYWTFNRQGGDGIFEDARGGPDAVAYSLVEAQSLVRTNGYIGGPRNGVPALDFNGGNQFAFIEHDSAFEVTQGTIALWVRPDDLGESSIFLSKDASGNGDGGHFRLGHTDDGGLFLRMAPGDGGSNVSWETSPDLLNEGRWQHIAVSFTENGVTVYLDGQAVPNSAWSSVEGDVGNPGVYTEAFFVNNHEPWVLGADSSGSENADTAQEFGADAARLDRAFDGALAEFGFWGGFEPGDALNSWQLNRLISHGPGQAVTADSGPEPMAAGDDEINGGRGDDTIDGGAGDDVLRGNQGRDFIEGGYGDDILNGGNGDDVLNGGRGSDMLLGGAGNDLLISVSDVGEPRIGQLVTGNPTRPADPGSLNWNRAQLRDWVDQAIVGDDVMVGGRGRDHFYFETRINARLDIIMEHVNEDRTIDWAGVAGENTYLHDHWVDSLGIEVITDYNAGQDTISVIGHTTNVRVTYEGIDTNGDGIDDAVVSIIEVYSQQMGGGGGAHDQDNLGYIVVHGDLVNVEDINTQPGVTYGIVDTIDELNEAVAPTGETRRSTGPDGSTLTGYDSRDTEGDPIGSDPSDFSENPFLAGILRSARTQTLGDAAPMWVVASDPGREFFGGGYDTLGHTRGMARAQGTWAFSFTADEVGHREMALISKDHLGYESGGHLSIWIDEQGYLRVRMQGTHETRELRFHDERIEAGETYNIAFTFNEQTLSLFVNGELVDVEDGVEGGMVGNTEDMLIGGSSIYRRDGLDNADWFFDGSIENVTLLNRRMTEVEAVLFDEFGGDASMLLTSINALDLPRTVGNNWGQIMNGTSGHDLILSMGGDDNVSGGDGHDFLIGGEGDDVLSGQRGLDTLRGEEGDDSLYGGGHNDILDGGLGDDTLHAGWGHDVVSGGYGNDVIMGDGGNDIINGGAGNDFINGGDGRDTIVFDFFGSDNADTVRHFVTGTDQIAFDETVFDLGDNLRDAFVRGTSANDADARLIYDRPTGRLFYDADGSGSEAEMEIVARFGAGTNLVLDDITTI
ncbi:LamG-like jellyroll fold domain-containing protein [Algicella marina]|uniref:Uncharacterized protein n=1 Tax=Algicella marina TaxID=2683284 RepID=A0A6P1T0S3_9RHOB|nr:LamG-like jellyroll fold domain-containing protein [Algicella marina]QHQ35243.1 hypothetical protein GO499_08540 [Algicella marina]